MGDYLVTCVVKPNRLSSHEHLTHIGNIAGAWKITRESAIQRIDSRTDTFYTQDAHNRRVNIGVVREAGKVPYLRTHADNQWNDNLLALAECSGSCNLV